MLIPVYQRKYDWKIDNCRQLYEDLKKVPRDAEAATFLEVLFHRSFRWQQVEFHIIDGQHV
ncbi:MAG: DUF262 domain-containing protein [bacterium LCO1.1]|uniref:DUF262 domain-containing protein n=1 Tax=Candidatus Weimeria bifida TaxID=2599074 RepID=A0A6N7IYX8_9FIRM|nr:DUF262 domain-containing protein [Candidatus Weimeria bifida]